MKKRLKRFLPDRVRTALVRWRCQLALGREFYSDRARYSRHCLPGEISRMPVGAKGLEAQLIKDYHRIEKGLALPAPKRPFGSVVGDRIEANAAMGRERGAADVAVALAESAQQALRGWNEEGVISHDIAPVASQDDLRDTKDVGGFFRSRHSVRDFNPTDVPDRLLSEAVSLALHSPSVCNRQAWFVRFYRDDDVARILAFQNGNRGFTDVVPVVGLVTVDARMFAGPGERNQPWIEGGIFSMSLVWALHALGVHSCMLNMSVHNAKADALRKEFGLGDNELVIMMIAIGYARAGHRVARSPRRELAEVQIPSDTCPRSTRRD